MRDRLANYYPGTWMQVLKVGAGVAGTMVSLRALEIVLTGVCVARYFLLASVAGGIGVFFLIRSNRHSS